MKNVYLGFLLTILNFSIAYSQPKKPEFVTKPYLQFTTPSSVRVHWETEAPGSTKVYYGTAKLETATPIWDSLYSIPGIRTMHYAQLSGLHPETIYFYQTLSVKPNGDSLLSDIYTFKTAVKDSTPYAFTVFSDSQMDNADPEAWKRVSTQALKERPDFALHAGDLVDLGYRKNDWVSHFLKQAHDFMKNIPIYSIPGNHEHDAAWYYHYMYVPRPYYYSFRYGNAEIFMLDTNQYQEEGTDMYNWLEQALAKSTAYWKFVVHHHPPYSSDEDDFGNTRYEASTSGDEEVKGFMPLYDKYGVDIVFYGHIHAYERTWPILADKAVNQNGVIYVNIGGAGGRLENPAPLRSWFTSKLKTIHHFAYVAVNGNSLQYQAIDDEGQLFDQFTLTESRKNRISKELVPAAPIPLNNRKIFIDTIHVSLQSSSPGEVIRYTTNDTEPNEYSSVYKEKLILDKTTTLKIASFNQYGKSRTNTIRYVREKPFASIKLSHPVPGLRYRYFETELKNDEDPDKFLHLRFLKKGETDRPDFSRIEHREQHWGVVSEGYIRVPADGYYRFYGHAEHILRLDIQGKMLFEEPEREINYEGDMYLKAGYHPVKIYYYNKRKDRVYLELYYSGPGIERQPIPKEAWWQEK